MKRIFTLTCLLVICAIMAWVAKINFFSIGENQDLSYDTPIGNPHNYPKTDKPLEIFRIYKDMTYRDGKPTYLPGYKIKELKKALNSQNSVQARVAALNFDERGPSNVPGRTRGLIVDPGDPSNQTWLAGTVGGGIWKTTNGGMSWTNKTPEFPNLSTTSLAYSESNPDIIYAGTGEGWLGSAGFIGGSGVFKSLDRGETWTHLEATNNVNFDVINRLIVHPANPDILLACTNNDPIFGTGFFSYILKSTDGGATWEITYEGDAFVQQIIADPTDFNTLYASVRGIGVIKSTDAGETWVSKSNGMTPSGRIELAISPIDNNRLFASAEGNLTFQRVDGGDGSDIYFTDDAGENWLLLKESSEADIDYFNTQGWYDNAIMAHPFNKDIVYVGGVGIFKVDLQDEITVSDPIFAGVIEENTSFLSLVNFEAGEYYGGKISTGSASEFTSIEIRFGPGKVQKAHRYTVPEGSGPGVPASSFAYQDYVDVPFEVWDIDSEPPRQLMIGFRDQQRDGEFNLILNNTTAGDENNHSREYLYINAIDYDPNNPNSGMAQDGGHESNNMYFLWPYLTEGATWNAANLPEARFAIFWRPLTQRAYAVSSVADVYGYRDGKNAFEQNTGETQVTGVHPDMHGLIPIIHDVENQEWQILNANDGGVYVSNVATDPGVNDGDWEFAGHSLNTTQFYAVDKMPGGNRYIGGSQDNGTWMNQAGDEGSEVSQYARALGGDGFGTVWHCQDPMKLLGSIYNLSIYRSINGGLSWSTTSGTITDLQPFITKLENSHSQPDVVFTVGESGVWRSENFGLSWQLTPISSNWELSGSFNNVEISDATPDVIWAGHRMNTLGLLHVSTDNGKSFSATALYDEIDLGFVSGIASHPTDHKTAYALFSYAESPKILRTTDLGETWEDISGFSPSSTSTGFPDVAVMDLIVMPHDTDILWAGTEIGIFESTDNGQTWHILDADLPRVSVWDMNINDDQLVVGTHGRGIWSYTLPVSPEITYYPQLRGLALGIDGAVGVLAEFSSPFDSAEVFINGSKAGTLNSVEPGLVQTSFAVDISNQTVVETYLVAYKGASPFTTRTIGMTKYEYTGAVSTYVDQFGTEKGNFVGDMSIRRIEGFTSNAIHTPHDYEVSSEYTYLLRVPVTISSSNATLSYRDIALVEPESDYVVLEGSLDGLEWITLGEAYDASYNDQWESLYSADLSPAEENLVMHEIDLLEHFDAGDEVVFRFRLFSDEETTGWGWMIDDLNIQGVILSAPSELHAADIRVYPNPASAFVTIESAKRKVLGASLIDLRGARVSGKFNKTFDRLDVSGLSKGIYVLKLDLEDGNSLNLKVVKE